jgi:hypothetical protein
MRIFGRGDDVEVGGLAAVGHAKPGWEGCRIPETEHRIGQNAQASAGLDERTGLSRPISADTETSPGSAAAEAVDVWIDRSSSHSGHIVREFPAPTFPAPLDSGIPTTCSATRSASCS